MNHNLLESKQNLRLKKKKTISSKIVGVIIRIIPIALFEYLSHSFGVYEEMPPWYVLILMHLGILFFSIAAPTFTTMIFGTFIITVKIMDHGKIGALSSIIMLSIIPIYTAYSKFKNIFGSRVKYPNYVEEYNGSLLNYNLSELYSLNLTVNKGKSYTLHPLVNAILIKYILNGSITVYLNNNDLKLQLVKEVYTEDPAEIIILSNLDENPIKAKLLMENIAKDKYKLEYNIDDGSKYCSKIGLKTVIKKKYREDWNNVLGSKEFLRNIRVNKRNIDNNLINDYILQAILLDLGPEEKANIVALLEENKRDIIRETYTKLESAGRLTFKEVVNREI